MEQYRSLAAASDGLSVFPASADLIRHLHAPDLSGHNGSADALLLELLKPSSEASLYMRPRLLLLVFIPTIHRTTSHVKTLFPSLARDDISQHLMTVFLEFLDSAELQTRRSHIAFAIARKLRRRAFRWAIHECRGAMPEEAARHGAIEAREIASDGPLHARILLHEFLDRCEKAGWLTPSERSLLLRFKVEGLSCRELARLNGHSAVAIQHRIQRLLDRLRRLAKKAPREIPEQLALFPDSPH
jgi:hypothetical protein